jgi:hypothetical protein
MNAKRYPCVGIYLVHILHDSTTTALQRYQHKICSSIRSSWSNIGLLLCVLNGCLRCLVKVEGFGTMPDFWRLIARIKPLPKMHYFYSIF